MRIRRREASAYYGPSKNNSNIKVSWYIRDVAIATIELIDNLANGTGSGQHRSRGTGNKTEGDAKEVDCTVDSSEKTKNTAYQTFVGVDCTDGKARGVRSRGNPRVAKKWPRIDEKETQTAEQNEETRRDQQCVAQALGKIESWADAWLAGKLSTDEDWKSFEKCLDGLAP